MNPETKKALSEHLDAASNFIGAAIGVARDLPPNDERTRLIKHADTAVEHLIQASALLRQA